MKPIILIGMMGSGKTTIGQLLSQQLNLPMIDTDQHIEQTTNTCISELFERYGEAHFRELEHQSLQTVLTSDCIISTGGGIIVTPKNMKLLQQGLVFYLKTDIQTLVTRLDPTHRPLLHQQDVTKKLQSLLENRAHLYEEAADFMIDTTQLTEDEVVSRILMHLHHIN